MVKIEAISAAFVKNNRSEVLLLERTQQRTHAPGKWDLMGGDIQPGVTPRETLVSDAIKKLQIGTVDVLEEGKLTILEPETMVTRHIFVCTGDYSQIAVDPEKYNGYRWQRTEELQETLLTPGAVAVLTKLRMKK